jgi:hypothetical protein
MSLRFDSNLQGIDRTIFVTPGDTGRARNILAYNKIDCQGWLFVRDQEIERAYPDLQHWRVPNDPRNTWLYQQGLKLAALDMMGTDTTVIHDPDTWMIQPYNPWSDDRLQLLTVPSYTEYNYQGLTEHLLGVPDDDSRTFVTEIHAVRREDWLALKDRVEQRHSGSWLEALIRETPVRSDGLKWFSEYHVLGNWAMSRGSVDLMPQQRYEIQDISDLETIPKQCNAVCDVSSGESAAFRFKDHRRGRVERMFEAQRYVGIPDADDWQGRYFLCWFDRVSTTDIRRGLHVDECIDLANSGDIWSQMNMMRINWMVRDLGRYPMYKPIVVDHNWFTIVGDTRLMACDLLGIDHVQVLAQLKTPQGRVLEDIHELFDILDMQQDRNLTWTPTGSDPHLTYMTWFDISDEVAAEHIITDESAESMIRQYLALHPQGRGFQFTREWCREPIDWASFSNLTDQSAVSLRKIS